MIRSSSDIWNSKDMTLMLEFRDRFFTTYADFQRLSSVDILCSLLDRLDIQWDDSGNLPEDVYSMHERMGGFSFSGNPRYLITTDQKTKDNDELLLECLFHELAHIFLEHVPACAGDSSLLTATSDFGVFFRTGYNTLFQKNSNNYEHEADLMTAVFLFHPYDDFIRDSWRNPLKVRTLAKKYRACPELVAQMLIAHNETTFHLFYVDVENKCFMQKYIPYTECADFFDEARLLKDSSSAVYKALQSKKDAVADSGKGQEQFHCEAFYLSSSQGEQVLVLGTKKTVYDQKKSLASKFVD